MGGYQNICEKAALHPPPSPLLFWEMVWEGWSQFVPKLLGIRQELLPLAGGTKERYGE